jgi:uncharacterized cupredoxin-like copper-binding protein
MVTDLLERYPWVSGGRRSSRRIDLNGGKRRWPATAPAGEVTFEVANDGTTEHEFEIFRTDLAPDALPTTDDGSVDSEGEGVEEIDEIEEFEPGNTETLTTELEAGNYVMICNVVVGDTSHYQEGMRAGFVVD